MTTRRRVREVVLQVLYESDLNTTVEPADAAAFVARRLLDNPALISFANELLKGVRSNKTKIDSLLTQYAVNWSVKRMAVVDRNVLRIATYELYFGNTPKPVAINEAIELAKRYGNRNSASFINGILDRLQKGTEGSASPTVPHDSGSIESEKIKT